MQPKSNISESALLDACRILFGTKIDLSSQFLAYLQPAGAKSAYREKAKKNHPDLFADSPPGVRRRQSELFQEIHGAYKLLASYLDQRNRPGPPPTRPAGGEERTAKDSGPYRRGTGGPPHLPRQHLEFGLFLYYRGLIAYPDLIAALLWQRRQRPNLGALAKRWGWLDDQKIQATLQHRGSGNRFGTRALQLGFLTGIQLQALLRYQQTLHKKFGQYFVEQGILKAADIDRLAEDLDKHNQGIAVTNRYRSAATGGPTPFRGR
ncbi:DnaJ-like heat shock protein [Desulfuromonas soudanensis]|uniref:DnaJ-like heat shock protein n=1 Tax=Desulfuromonas soudanensis TaxID=1603606 RepID=A0A0M4D8T9_9BACT|nr:J domain-containing protein [Desulfuromonas soudanensis]ALC17810.1 DnaJ-like heat shock protein [Desulfuromonas soudanensis]